MIGGFEHSEYDAFGKQHPGRLKDSGHCQSFPINRGVPAVDRQGRRHEPWLLGSSRMKTRGEAAGERGDRRRRRQNLHPDPARPIAGLPPTVEREALQMVAGDQAGLASRSVGDDDTRR